MRLMISAKVSFGMPSPGFVDAVPARPRARAARRPPGTRAPGSAAGLGERGAEPVGGHLVEVLARLRVPHEVVQTPVQLVRVVAELLDPVREVAADPLDPVAHFL